MKHAKDPGTVEMKLPAKRGRPTIYSSALSPAERARRYRQNKPQRFGKAFTDPGATDTATLIQALAWVNANGTVTSPLEVRLGLISEVAAKQLAIRIVDELHVRFFNPLR